MSSNDGEAPKDEFDDDLDEVESPRPSMSESEIEDYLREAERKKFSTVHLNSCALDQVPERIFSFGWLDELDLEDNNISTVDSRIGRLSQLTRLDLWNNPGLQLSSAVGQLKRLQFLAVGPDVEVLPPQIAFCTELKSLALGNNGLTELPVWITELFNLEEIQLWGNRLETLPWEFGNLTSLTACNLFRNNLADLPVSMQSLKKLTSLNLEQNRLESIPEGVTSLRNLRYLGMARNNVKQVPSHVYRLKSLQHLDLSENFISSLPESFEAMARLEILDLQRNEFDTFPEQLNGLPALRVINVAADGSVAVIYDEAGSPDVYAIEGWKPDRHRGQMRITSIPEAVLSLPKLEAIVANGNPLQDIPREVIDVANQPDSGGSKRLPASTLLDYLRNMRAEHSPLNEGKLILLGWGGAGKTSLVNRLVRNTFDEGEVRTEGIRVTEWDTARSDGRPVRFNIWDFGGQEIMHATHQFFLTARSIYILVLNGRSGDADSDAAYWMSIIHSFAPDCPVIIVRNQIKKDPFEIETRPLLNRYRDNIYTIVSTDCAEGRDGFQINELREEIKELASGMSELDVQFPAHWKAVKDRLATLDADFLTFDQYRTLCNECGEQDEHGQEQLASYLHLLGNALNYRDDSRLRDTHVLNPRWVTEGIYTILNSPAALRQKGEISIEDLANILPPSRYPQNKHIFLLELMRKFELCFPFQDDPDRFLIPDLLPRQTDDEIPPLDESLDVLRFRYRYPVLPEGVFPRFIVRSYILSIGQPRWRSGVVLEWEGNAALVTADRSSNLIDVSIGGPKPGRRRLLTLIRSDFMQIHRAFSFKVSSIVPVRGPESFEVDYDHLITFERGGFQTFPMVVDGRIVEIDVAATLNGVSVPSQRPFDGNAERRAPRAFVTYSRADREQLARLEPHLKLLTMHGVLSAWTDQEIDPGDDWREELDDALHSADIYIALLSPEFLVSKFINDVELPVVFSRRDSGASTVLPVVVRDCMWSLTEFAKIQMLPDDAKPLAGREKQDVAWREVGDAISDTATRLLQTRRSGFMRDASS